MSWWSRTTDPQHERLARRSPLPVSFSVGMSQLGSKRPRQLCALIVDRRMRKLLHTTVDTAPMECRRSLTHSRLRAGLRKGQHAQAFVHWYGWQIDARAAGNARARQLRLRAGATRARSRARSNSCTDTNSPADRGSPPDCDATIDCRCANPGARAFSDANCGATAE
jgi:hypothetical protein